MAADVVLLAEEFCLMCKDRKPQHKEPKKPAALVFAVLYNRGGFGTYLNA